MPTVAEVRLWGRTIAAVSLGDGEEVAAFEYGEDFAESGIEISPLVLPLSRRIYTFPSLPLISFHGLPGLLADSLPDRFGNALIDAWLATQGRTSDSFNARAPVLHGLARDGRARVCTGDQSQRASHYEA